MRILGLDMSVIPVDQSLTSVPEVVAGCAMEVGCRAVDGNHVGPPRSVSGDKYLNHHIIGGFIVKETKAEAL
jgi:hypothetical protein